jgi:hypothetical protein
VVAGQAGAQLLVGPLLDGGRCHDAGAPDCDLAAKSIAQRLLKMGLASAIRAAGWHRYCSLMSSSR